MSNYDLNTLNEQQLKALYEIDGAVLVNAGAGSGKTRLLTHRITYMIKEKGIMPYNILAITFTNKAANEMKERIASMCDRASDIWISTFHAMCSKILRRDISRLEGFSSNFTIYSDSDIDKVFKTIFEAKNISDDKLIKKITSRISYIKNNNMKISEFLLEFEYDEDSKLVAEVYDQYKMELRKNNALDFDDLMIKTYELLTTKEDVRDYYQNKFKYILVDEFQDTNKIQYDLVKLLAGKHKNVFVVGDEDQCIYTWRGALHTNLATFKRDFSSKVYNLERNYRSTKNILSVANKVIKNNSSRMDKTLYTENSQGDNVEYVENYSEKEEAEFVARKIYKLVKDYGYKYSDFAVLMRLNALSFPFEECLLSYNIPHKIYGGFKFFERLEIKNLVAYLRIFDNLQDDVALTRIINFPKRNIGQVAIDTLRGIAEKNRVSMVEVVSNINDYAIPVSLKNKLEFFSEKYNELKELKDSISLTEFVENVISKFNIKNAFPSDSDEDINKCENINMFVSMVEGFEEKNEGTTLTEFLENITLISDIDGLNEEDNNVTIATIHAMKGLEFKVVFIVGAEEKIFPITRAYDSTSEMEEERRLMYVAITRAKEKLFITSSRTRFIYGKRDYMMKSRFLAETGLVIQREKVSTTSASSYSSYESNENYQAVGEKRNTYSYSPQKQSVFQTKTTLSSYMESNKEKIDTSKYKIGDDVLHPKFGIGKILSFSSDRKCADIDFKGLGVKTLMLEIAPLKVLGVNNG